MKKFLRLVTLKPYGKNLTDGVVDIWLLFAMLNISAVAFCDAIAWAYLGYTAASGWQSYATAAIAGSIALTIVGSLDATFVMHDTSHAFLADPSFQRRGLVAWWRANVQRGQLAVAVRIALALLSFTVTAPFLTQLFFNRDISAAIDRENEQAIALKRTELAAKYDKHLTEASTRLAGRQKDLEREVAGAGQSGRYGNGPTARAIRSDVESLQTEIGSLEAARVAELHLFDTATPDVRAKRYGVDLQREGPDTRAHVVSEMEKSSAFRTTRWTIKAFLAFLFLGLIALKLFQPPSVKVYFNGDLQAAYMRLKAGVFDAQLDPREQGGANMAPLHFARWYEQHQRLREVTDALRDRAAEVTERLRLREEAYTAVQKSLTGDITKMNEDLSVARNAGFDLEQRLTSARAELTALERTVVDQEQELRDFAQLRDDLPLRERQFLVDGRVKATQALASNRLRSNELSATIARLAGQVENNRTYCRTIALSIDQAGHDLMDVNKLIADARKQSVDNLT